jgi:aryl-alcohol dehydrogenase-like predicted oxidoreductase
MERCEASLRRLGTDYLDLYLLHFYDQLTSLAVVAETLEKLRDQGKIRHYGVSNFNVEELRAAVAAGNFAVLEPPYNFVQSGAEESLFPFCLAQGIGVMVYSPLHKGLLSGKYEGHEVFSDFRRHHPDFQGERFARLASAVRGLRPMADRYGLSIYQLVLAATLSHPAVHAAIVGIKDESQIREAAGALDRTIARPDYFEIREALSLGAAAKIRDVDGRVK